MSEGIKTGPVLAFERTSQRKKKLLPQEDVKAIQRLIVTSSGAYADPASEATTEQITELLNGEMRVSAKDSESLVSFALNAGKARAARALLESSAIVIPPARLNAIVDEYARGNLSMHTTRDNTEMLWALKARSDLRLDQKLLKDIIGKSITDRSILVCNSLLGFYEGDKRPFLPRIAQTMRSERDFSTLSARAAFEIEHYNNTALCVIGTHAPLSYKFTQVRGHINQIADNGSRLKNRMLFVVNLRPYTIDEEAVVPRAKRVAQPS